MARWTVSSVGLLGQRRSGFGRGWTRRAAVWLGSVAEGFFRSRGSPALKTRAPCRAQDCRACPGHWSTRSPGAAAGSGPRQSPACHRLIGNRIKALIRIKSNRQVTDIGRNN